MNRNGRTNAFMKSRVRQMSEVEAAWVGAIIEGEGYVVVAPKHSKHKAKMGVVNTDPEVLSALLRLTGAGSVGQVGRSRSKWSKKMCFTWQVQRWREVQDLARLCSPYCMKLQKVEV